jgi:arginine deiminase
VPAFEDEAMQERVWGRRWGVYNDLGPLRTVLVHRPGDEIRIMTADRYDPSIDTLRDLKIRWVEVHHADNPRVLNCLAVRPGKVLLAINNGDGTAERLVDHGVEVVPLQYAECQRNGGGIHCSTLPLVRDRS